LCLEKVHLIIFLLLLIAPFYDHAWMNYSIVFLCSNLDAAKLKERGRIFRDSFLSKVFSSYLNFSSCRNMHLYPFSEHLFGAGLASSICAFSMLVRIGVELFDFSG
jgi:hypothetical protein